MAPPRNGQLAAIPPHVEPSVGDEEVRLITLELDLNENEGGANEVWFGRTTLTVLMRYPESECPASTDSRQIAWTNGEVLGERQHR